MLNMVNLSLTTVTVLTSFKGAAVNPPLNDPVS